MFVYRLGCYISKYSNTLSIIFKIFINISSEKIKILYTLPIFVKIIAKESKHTCHIRLLTSGTRTHTHTLTLV